LAAIKNWFEDNEALLQQLGTASLVLLAITVVALPVVVAKLPEDYFTQERRESAGRSRKHRLLWGFVALLKNLLGIVLILAGLAMLVLPGQGMVTILIGLALTNFPGKYAIERRIACQPAVGKTLNRIRALAGQPPLSMPPEADGIEESTNRSA
jgi:hypothetical protein